MAKVVTRKETGRLLIDFTYRGVRCREQTALLDNPANRKRVQAVVDRLTKAQRDGTFVYGEFFPGSSLLDRFSKPAADVAAPLEVKALESATTTPAFATFADQWITDHSIEWRRSHIRSVVSTPLRQTSCRLPFHADDPRRSDTTCKRFNIPQSS